MALEVKDNPAIIAVNRLVQPSFRQIFKSEQY
jgi:hypothetical protein